MNITLTNFDNYDMIINKYWVDINNHEYNILKLAFSKKYSNTVDVMLSNDSFIGVGVAGNKFLIDIG